MNNKSFFIFIITFSLIAITSCKKETSPPVEKGYEYFPVNVGHWVIYDVDSTYYDDFTQSINHTTFQIKEVIESVFYDNQNRLTQRIERYKRDNDTSEWTLQHVNLSNCTSTTAEKVELNIRYLKLAFPISESKEWDGNALNSLYMKNINKTLIWNGILFDTVSVRTDYEYEHIHEPYTVNGITYDSTTTVIQNNESINFICSNEQFEVYAKHIGLIYKKYKYLKYTTDPNYTTHIISTRGTDYTYKIVSYGN